MHALVTGANGFVGRTLCRRLAERPEGNNTVRALVRRRTESARLEQMGVTVFHGDVTEEGSLPAALEGVDTVFHLAGIRRSPTRAPFFDVNAEGTRKVCEAMLQSTTARKIVLCGSLTASGPSTPDRPRREEDPLQPTDPYGESKAEAERILFSYGDRLDVSVIRPPRILGPGDVENLAFFKLVKRGYRARLGGGPRPLSMVDVEDVVTLFLLVAERPEAKGEVFFATTEETTTLEEVQDEAAAELGISLKTIPIAPAALQTLAFAADVFSQVTSRHLTLNRKLARQLLAPAWTCSAEKAKRVLGFSARWSLRDSVRRSARWYVENGWV
jgi:nucleoside-diphosphate-sugar epimerase